ncbi:MAG: 3-deoxy-D-manno-octulosonic acid transferase [Litorimonas sp.]
MNNPLKTPLAYRIVTSLIAPFLPLLIHKRVRAGKEDRARIGERYGRTSVKRPIGTMIWLHGASVGETQMLRPIIARLLETPGRSVLVTSGTKTSADLMADQLPKGAIHQYLPVDTPRATARFIAHWRPDLAVFAESEIWPNLIWTTKRAGVPLALINARMSEKSLTSWAKRRPIAYAVFEAFTTILAADEQTADGITQLSHATVPNIGSLKFEAPALDFDHTQFDALRADIGDRKIWLAASTHEAEEDVFHQLLSTLREEAYLIWVPRHPERGKAIANRLGTTPRSGGGKPRGHAYVMDTMGEMGLALALADVCVLGGSFHASLMGHNPLEAARAGVPVITGPYHASFIDLYRKMSDFDGVKISDPREAATLIRDGLNGRLDDIAANAQGFASQSSGTLDRTIQELEQLL